MSMIAKDGVAVLTSVFNEFGKMEKMGLTSANVIEQVLFPAVDRIGDLMKGAENRDPEARYIKHPLQTVYCLTMQINT